MSAPAKLRAADLKAAIGARYAAPAYQTCFEVGNATGAAGRTYADAVAMGLWPSNGHEIIGFEVKVSRSDWLAEKKASMKAQPVMQFCNRWFLVVPRGLVKADEVPETWGLMTFDDGKLREARKAPRLSPVPASAGFIAAMVRRAGEGDSEVRRADVAAATAKIEKNFNDRFERQIEQRLNSFRNGEKDRAEKLRRIEAALGQSLSRFYDDESFAKAVAFVNRSGVTGSYSHVSRVINALRSAEAELSSALETVKPTESA